MPAIGIRKAYFLCTFHRTVIGIVECLSIYIESDLHAEWRDQYFICVVHVL